MRRHQPSQAPGVLLLAVWIAALLIAIWLGGCAPRPQSQAGRPSVSTAHAVYRAVFPLLETLVLWGLDWARPEPEPLVAEPYREPPP